MESENVRTFYIVADALDGNFYEDEYVAADIAEALDKVEALIDKLSPLLAS